MRIVGSGRFRFGGFEFDNETLDLRRDGASVRLQTQPKQVLAHLLRHSDRIVSRDELQKVVWGDQTFVDFEHGLNFCLSQIRSALKDDATRPIYIRTFAKQGYHFIASVQWIPAATADSSPAVAAQPYRSRRTNIMVAAILVATAIGLVAAYWRIHHPIPTPIVAVVRFDNETGDPALTRFADSLTDNFVERLTSLSQSRYQVIGNARILRGPRDARDLQAIAATLHANYVVLGQVQAHNAQTRILVHLIHMPEQTHVRCRASIAP